MRRSTIRPGDQLELPFPARPASAPSLAGGGTWQLFMSIDLPAVADPQVIKRIDQAGRRLRRGAVAGDVKLRKLAAGLEEIAGLFDGQAPTST